MAKLPEHIVIIQTGLGGDYFIETSIDDVPVAIQRLLLGFSFVSDMALESSFVRKELNRANVWKGISEIIGDIGEYFNVDKVPQSKRKSLIAEWDRLIEEDRRRSENKIGDRENKPGARVPDTKQVVAGDLEVSPCGNYLRRKPVAPFVPVVSEGELPRIELVKTNKRHATLTNKGSTKIHVCGDGQDLCLDPGEEIILERIEDARVNEENANLKREIARLNDLLNKSNIPDLHKQIQAQASDFDKLMAVKNRNVAQLSEKIRTQANNYAELVKKANMLEHDLSQAKFELSDSRDRNSVLYRKVDELNERIKVLTGQCNPVSDGKLQYVFANAESVQCDGHRIVITTSFRPVFSKIG